jgi:DNA replication protein DnaC
VQRHELISALGELRLRGMAAAFDEAVVHGIRQRRTVEEILGELLRAEAAERQSRSIRYRLGIAGLPEMKDLDSFRFDLSPVNEALARSLHAGAFLAQRRNAVLVGGTGTGKTHLSIAITAQAIRAGTRARFFNAVDLVNRLEAESRNGRPACWPPSCAASTSSCSTSSATCRSRAPAASCCSTSWPGSTPRPRSS